jgi:hypothetical protein
MAAKVWEGLFLDVNIPCTSIKVGTYTDKSMFLACDAGAEEARLAGCSLNVADAFD